MAARLLGSKRLRFGGISSPLCIALVVFPLWVSVSDLCFANNGLTPQAEQQAEQFFETHIRPLLVQHCYECHSGDTLKGGLALDSRIGAYEGGDSGPAVVAGEPDESPLVQAVRYDGLEMPPTGRLSTEQIKKIEDWVRGGAYWPQDTEGSQRKRSSGVPISDTDREHWAFQPVKKVSLPTNSDSPLHPVDAFLAQSLSQAGLTPNGPASNRVIVQRLYFGLTGLPPTHVELEEWTDRLGNVNGSTINEAEYDALVTMLLGRPAYGEHWARHWLDVVRFAQSNGYERDGFKPYSWRYRDYVIRAFHEDKPYDRFILEQIAGDELADADDDSRIATAFYRLGVWDDEPDDARQAEFDELDDVMVTMGAAFMGLTIGCARCHDHKFDPIPQADYYRLLAFIRNVRRYENPQTTLENASSLPLGEDLHIRSVHEEVVRKAKEREQAIANAESEEERSRLTSMPLDRSLTGLDWTLAVREHTGVPPETHVLIRGDAGSPGQSVEPGFLQVLDFPSEQTSIEESSGDSADEIQRDRDDEGAYRSESTLADIIPSSGRRLALARWLASAEHPLTARVIVNRVWHYHFGKGIVETTADFGLAGSPPTHPELLDWLADDFVKNGWSLKHLHRRIVTSAAYRRSSSIDLTEPAHKIALQVDPGNRLYWRGNLRRLNAEAIRDRMLFTSGELNMSFGGPEMYPQLSAEVLAGQSRPGLDWQVSPRDQQARRSIYGVVKRGVRDPLLQAFDYSNDSSPLVERPTTTVAPQALMLLHGQFTADRAGALADYLQSSNDDVREQLRHLYHVMFQREPTSRELETALHLIEELSQEYLKDASRITFRPAVPLSLYGQYRRALTGEHFLFGPRGSWSYFGGVWGGEYEGIESLDPMRGPFALWNGEVGQDGVLEGELRIAPSVDYLTLINRGAAVGNTWHGVGVLIDRIQGTISGRVRSVGVDETEAVKREFPASTWVPFRWVIHGDESEFWLGRGESSEVIVRQRFPAEARQSGAIGIAVWGGQVDMRELFWNANTVGASSHAKSEATDEDGGEVVRASNTPLRLDIARIEGVTDGYPLPDGWSRYDGEWRREAKHVWHVGANRGAKILWDAVPVIAGDVQVQMNFTEGESHIAAILMCVSDPKVGADNWFGYEIGLDIRNQTVFVGDHRNNFRLLESKPTVIRAGDWKALRARLTKDQLLVYVENAAEPTIVHDLQDRLQGTLVGLRTWDSDVRFREFEVTGEGPTVTANWGEADIQMTYPLRDDAQWSRKQALAAVCRTLFNLSEFVYVE